MRKTPGGAGGWPPALFEPKLLTDVPHSRWRVPALQEFRDLYNHTWILQKHGFLTPSQVRAKLTARQEEAA
jgi:hypothetical protein